jgi:4-alpha-glucanotransferase
MYEFIKKTVLSMQWKKIGIFPHHGIDLPLSALVTQKSCGIGEYLDLLPMIDFCKEVGFDVIQLLPLNDSGSDPSPYNALSSKALHPIYLSLESLEGANQSKDLLDQIRELKAFNLTKKVEYHEVLHRKYLFLEKYFSLVGPSILSRSQYHRFIKENPWVMEYALYKTLKMSMSFASWDRWPKELRDPSEHEKDNLLKLHQRSISYYCFIQFLCFEQLKQVKKYAEKSNILIKGDIPILISPDSADVWMEREYFDTSFEIGYPPDVFNEKGQMWGFPALLWDKIEEKNYDWWKLRLSVGESLYHLYRIDHAAGFYRLFRIPKGLEPKEGFYFPNDLSEAIKKGHIYMKEVVSSSSMLPIAEDLGNIPDELRASLFELGVAGTRVIRWERNYEEDGSYKSPIDYSFLTMSCVSTHDSLTLEQWWHEEKENVKDFASQYDFEYPSNLDYEKRLFILKLCHSTKSLFHINLFQEYLCLYKELSHENYQEERINIPGKILPENWTYRFHVSLEEIQKHQGLKKDLKMLSKLGHFN